MSTNIISFEEDILGRKPKSDMDEKAMHETCTDIEKKVLDYWNQKEGSGGPVYTQFIEMFQRIYDGSILSMLNALTYMNVYLSERGEDIYVGERMNLVNETGFAYADFYEWFVERFSENEEVHSAVLYNFNDELPVILKVGEFAEREIASIRWSYEYDRLEKKCRLRSTGDKVLAYIRRKSKQMGLIMFMSHNQVDFLADELALCDEMDDDVRIHMQRMLKMNLFLLANEGGTILFCYADEEKRIHVNGFSVMNEAYKSLNENEVREIIPHFLSISERNEVLPELIFASNSIGSIDEACLDEE